MFVCRVFKYHVLPLAPEQCEVQGRTRVSRGVTGRDNNNRGEKAENPWLVEGNTLAEFIV